MKHLRIFEKSTDYQSFKVSADYIEPNVSVVKELATSEAIKYNPIVVSSVISFTVDGVAFQADRGMYWHEWLESDYNTVGAFQANPDVWATVIWNNKALTLNGEYVYCTDSTYAELESDAIVENGAYETTRLPGPINLK